MSTIKKVLECSTRAKARDAQKEIKERSNVDPSTVKIVDLGSSSPCRWVVEYIEEIKDQPINKLNQPIIKLIKNRLDQVGADTFDLFPNVHMINAMIEAVKGLQVGSLYHRDLNNVCSCCGHSTTYYVKGGFCVLCKRLKTKARRHINQIKKSKINACN